jgi:hypothetical protein
MVEINGQPVQSHSYSMWLLIEDTETGRQYLTDRCSLCGDLSVAYTTSDYPEIQSDYREFYQQVVTVPYTEG